MVRNKYPFSITENGLVLDSRPLEHGRDPLVYLPEQKSWKTFKIFQNVFHYDLFSFSRPITREETEELLGGRILPEEELTNEREVYSFGDEHLEREYTTYSKLTEAEYISNTELADLKRRIKEGG